MLLVSQGAALQGRRCRCAELQAAAAAKRNTPCAAAERLVFHIFVQAWASTKQVGTVLFRCRCCSTFSLAAAAGFAMLATKWSGYRSPSASHCMALLFLLPRPPLQLQTCDMWCTGTRQPALKGCTKKPGGECCPRHAVVPPVGCKCLAWRVSARLLQQTGPQVLAQPLRCSDALLSTCTPTYVMPASLPSLPCSGGRDGQPALSVIYASNAELQEFKRMEKGSRQGSTAAVAAYIQVGGVSN